MPSKPGSKPKSQSSIDANSSEVVTLQDSLIKRLIQSGEWDRISALLKEKLSESGWTDETYHQTREHARQQPRLHFRSLMEEVVPKVEANVPSSVKEEVLAMIKTFVEENTAPA